MIYQTKIDAAKNMPRHYVFDAQRSRFGEQCVTHGLRKEQLKAERGKSILR